MNKRFRLIALDVDGTIRNRERQISSRTRNAIERVRGVGASGVIRSLRARDLIAPSGRLDTVGQPLLWSVPPRFLDHFGLSALDQLPPLEDLEPPAQQSVLPLEPNEDV